MEHQIRKFDSLIELVEELDRAGVQGARRQRIVNRFMMSRARKAGIPYAGSFELTPLCNLDCKMCYVYLSQAQLQRAGRILTTEEWLDIMGQAIEAGMMQAELTGGECTMHPGFKRIYHYLVSRGVRTSILSNGQLLTADMTAFLTRYRPERVQISVYGSNPEAYLRVTGHDAFQDVMDAIGRLKDAGLRVSLSVMPSRYMKEDAQALLERVRSLGVEYGVSGVTLSARTETQRDINEYAADEQMCLEIDRNEKAYRDQFRADAVLRPEPYLFPLAEDATHEGTPCSAGHCAFHVNWKGQLTPCVPFDSVAKPILPDGFMAAWKEIRDTMRSYQVPKECFACEISAVCQACPAEKTSGVLNGPLNKAVCAKWRRIVDAGLLER